MSDVKDPAMPYGTRLDALPLPACPAAQRVVVAYDVPDARELGDIATGSEDRVIVAPLCSRCAARRLWIGAGEPPAHGCDGTMYWPTASDATQLIVA